MEHPSQENQAQPRLTIPLRSAPSKNNLAKLIPVAIVLAVIVLGAFTGLIASSRLKNKQIAQSQSTLTNKKEQDLSPQEKQNLQTVTRDSAEGVLEKNDKFEETAQGQWKLIRSGGESQTAFLTSSFLDLDQYVGKKVKVYGETLGSSKVGWLMDVAKIEVQ